MSEMDFRVLDQTFLTLCKYFCDVINEWGNTKNQTQTKEALDYDFVDTNHRRCIALSQNQSKIFQNQLD